MYNCIIFDIDGTLIDNERAILLSLQKIVRDELNKDLSME
ncbi:MAG: hypothetical protein PWP07_1462 [Epulopiscium sp.]|jgi:phosphoglycolate phosphatase-like HAD superfamily hydrolase|nr:phosphoglycolate phosphatase-like HAD superfamily hydrolase [Defluviitalea raffinosedens]MBZ4669536.1 hypothetical protein [Defluviitaleaceae bacterium]MDK2788236.1 hypothetical protein [Candidatus Epulonipiscium sp.]